LEPSLNVADLVPLVDDRDPQAMFDEWLAAVQASDPTWVPVNGSLETVVAEALCLTVSDLIYSINRLPGIVLEALLALKDLPRHPGWPAHGQVRISLDGVRPTTVPAGTRMMIDGIEFLVSGSVTVTDDEITVPVVAAETGSLANSILPGTGADLLDPDPHAVQAVTVGPMSGGADPESDLEYKQRLYGTFAIDQQSLVLPSAFVAYAAGLPDVARASALDLYDPEVGGDQPGHIGIFVHGYGGTLPNDRLVEIETALRDRAATTLQVHVMPVYLIEVNIDIEVKLAPGASETAVLPAVEAALRAAVNPALWTWGESLTEDELKAIAARVPGVDYATEATTSPTSAPVSFAPDELPTTGTVTVTVAPAVP